MTMTTLETVHGVRVLRCAPEAPSSTVSVPRSI